MPNRPQRSTGKRSRSRLDKDASRAIGEDRSRARRRRSLIASKVMAAMLLLGSFWLLHTFFTDQRFRVRNVTLKGTRLVPESDVQALLGLAGTSVFSVRAEELDARLRDAFGCITQVSVGCRLPDQVEVIVEEADIPFVWESGGRYWWIDAKGNVLGMVEGPGDLVIIHDLAGVARDPKGYIVGVPWDLARGMIDALPAAKNYDYLSQEGLVLRVTVHEWPVYLGYEGDAQAKVALMRKLVEQLSARGIDVEYIDLCNERHVTYKKR